MRNEPIPKKRTFVDIPVIDESWEHMFYHMEQRYPQGIILHAGDRRKARNLQSSALVMAKRFCYAISTSVQEDSDGGKLYIWQL